MVEKVKTDLTLASALVFTAISSSPHAARFKPLARLVKALKLANSPVLNEIGRMVFMHPVVGQFNIDPVEGLPRRLDGTHFPLTVYESDDPRDANDMLRLCQSNATIDDPQPAWTAMLMTYGISRYASLAETPHITDFFDNNKFDSTLWNLDPVVAKWIAYTQPTSLIHIIEGRSPALQRVMTVLYTYHRARTMSSDHQVVVYSKIPQTRIRRMLGLPLKGTNITSPVANWRLDAAFWSLAHARLSVEEYVQVIRVQMARLSAAAVNGSKTYQNDNLFLDLANAANQCENADVRLQYLNAWLEELPQHSFAPKVREYVVEKRDAK